MRSQTEQGADRTFTRYALTSVAWLVFLLMAGASGVSQKSVSLENGKVPKEFVGYKGTLLVELSDSKDYNKYARKAFTEQYHGEVKFVEASDWGSYKDVETYRFLITDMLFVKSGSNGTTYSHSLKLSDRMKGSASMTGSTSFYGKLLKAYAAELERVRKM